MNMQKKLPIAKKDLKFFVEGFLEKDDAKLSIATAKKRDAEKFWDRLVKILFKDIFWMDEADAEERVGTNFKKLILENHRLLKPIWIQFRESLFQYIEIVVPGEKKWSNLRRDVDKDKTSDLYQYRDLIKMEANPYLEKPFDIKLSVSFQQGFIDFHKRINIVKNFADLLQGIPIEYFAKCGHCDKCIILTRSDKRFCPGCAAKKHQADKWNAGRKAMQQKERERYRQRRK